MLGPLKFSLRATIDHHGPSIHSGHYAASINCWKKKKPKTLFCNDNKITEFEIIDSKNASTAYVILYELIDLWVLDSNRRVWVWLLPWRWHILSIVLIAGRGINAETCGLDDVFPPDDLFFPSRNSVLIYIYLYICILYTSPGYRTFIYIHKECRSVLLKLHPITVYETLFWGVRCSCFECHIGFTNCHNVLL